MAIRSAGRVLAGVSLAVGLLMGPMASIVAQEPDARPPFDTWLRDLRAEAAARGISEPTLAQALDRLEPLPVVVERDRTQAEFTRTIKRYLERRLTPSLIRDGRRALARHRTLLARVEKAYGVQPATLVAIWGLESNYGRFSGVRPIVAALATLAYEPRRSALFREELFQALAIVDRGDIELARLKGSWAGAMGQPQFMPSSYVKFAVDFDGDRRKDIWSSSADVFASMANYLSAHEWKKGERWGRRVTVPEAAREAVASATPLRTEGCRAVRQLTEPLPLKRWRQLGVRLSSGRPLPDSAQPGSLLQLDGEAFLVYRNYEAVLGYNCAHTYALSVVLLADRLIGR